MSLHFGSLGSSLGAFGLQFVLIVGAWGALWGSLGAFWGAWGVFWELGASLGELGGPFWDPGLHLEALGAPFSTPKAIEFPRSGPKSIFIIFGLEIWAFRD